MKILDAKGKLFGFINLIDFLALCLVGALALFLVLSDRSEPIVAIAPPTQPVIIKVFASEVPDEAAAAIQVGDVLENEATGYIGRITEVQITPGYTHASDYEGVLHKAYKEGFSAIEITALADGEVTATGIMINGAKYGVGHSCTIRAGLGKIYARVSGLEVQ